MRQARPAPEASARFSFWARYPPCAGGWCSQKTLTHAAGDLRPYVGGMLRGHDGHKAGATSRDGE